MSPALSWGMDQNKHDSLTAIAGIFQSLGCLLLLLPVIAFGLAVAYVLLGAL